MDESGMGGGGGGGYATAGGVFSFYFTSLLLDAVHSMCVRLPRHHSAILPMQTDSGFVARASQQQQHQPKKKKRYEYDERSC